jgi:4-aminobutyrate aminotransferase-like enzyme
MLDAKTGVEELNDSRSIVRRVRKLEAPGLRTFGDDEPFVIENAVGSWVEDPEGRRYLDLSGFHGVANIGHRNPAVVEALSRQAGQLIHCPTAFPSRVRAEFYEAVASILPKSLDAIVPQLGGGSANEIALLIAMNRKPAGEVISFSGGYHGRTVASVGLAGKTVYREKLGLPAQAQFVPYPYPSRMGNDSTAQTMDMLERLTSPGGGVESVSAVILEAVQGNGGVVIPPTDFLVRLREFCDRANALLIVDEVQAGCGRTGKMWAFEHANVVPDIVTIGKGLAGGLPVAATVAKRAHVSWVPDTIAGTFLANNLLFAAAIAGISVLRDGDLVSRSATLGRRYLELMRQRLGGLRGVADVRGIGLWIAVELTDANGNSAPLAAKLAKALRAKSVLIGTGGYANNVVKIAPALNIEEAELARGVELMIREVESYSRSLDT